jgi:L-fuconolactonase
VQATRIDAHQHFWRIARGDYGWLTPHLSSLYRDFEPADLAPLLVRHAIDRTILVQAAPTLEETRFLLDIARATPFVAGVVGWTDFEAVNAAETIGDLAAEPLLVGLRPMVQDIADDDWLTHAQLAAAFDAMAGHGLVLDALVMPRHLPRLMVVIERHPELTIVVDHGAKPAIGERHLDPWRAHIRAVASHPAAHVKLSGLVTEAGAQWSVDGLRPYVDHLLECFGPSRLLWGSDWPVVELAGGYTRWFEATEALLRGVSDDARGSIFGGNAARVYLQQRVG